MKEQEKFSSCWAVEKRRAFLAEGVAKMHGRKAAEKRRFGKIFKKMNAKYFV